MQKNNNGQTPKAFLTLKLDSMQTFELIKQIYAKYPWLAPEAEQNEE